MLKNFLKVSGQISPSFNHYLFYNSLSNVICGVETVMSSHSMLEASGVGNEDVLSILINLSCKDVAGQIISIPIIAKFSKLGDSNPKKHLAISTAIFETSNILENLTPLVPGFCFIPLASVANIGKNISFTGTGSFNANMINKLSTDKNNIAEIYSKVTAISTVSFSLGMIAGLCVVKLIPCYYTRLTMLLPLGIARYYCSIRSVKYLI